jgi:hypothetical protein
MSATSKLNIRNIENECCIIQHHNIENECLHHPTSGVVLPPPLDTTLNITCLQHRSLMLGLNMRFRNIQK